MSAAPPPVVSIVMALYNGESFLDAAVESVQAQSVADWELLIIDDGSSDGGLDRAQAWASEDARIRVLRHPGGKNRGVSATRNLGLSEARAPWVAILDCDDVWLPGKLERQLAILQEHPEIAVIYSRAQVIDDRGEPVHEERPGMRRPPIFGNGHPDQATRDFEGYLRFRYWIPASSAIFSRALAAACGDFHENLGYQVEDSLLWCQLSERGALWFQDEVLIQYRVHGNQWNQGLVPSKKARSRYAYLDAIHRSAAEQHRGLTAEVLVETGFDGLARTLISGHEIRPFRLIGYWLRLLATPGIPSSRRSRSLWILLKQLAVLPFKAVVLMKLTLTRA